MTAWQTLPWTDQLLHLFEHPDPAVLLQEPSGEQYWHHPLLPLDARCPRPGAVVVVKHSEPALRRLLVRKVWREMGIPGPCLDRCTVPRMRLTEGGAYAVGLNSVHDLFWTPTPPRALRGFSDNTLWRSTPNCLPFPVDERHGAAAKRALFVALFLGEMGGLCHPWMLP